MFYFRFYFLRKDLRTVSMENAGSGSVTGHIGSHGHNSRKVSWGLGIRWIEVDSFKKEQLKSGKLSNLEDNVIESFQK